MDYDWSQPAFDLDSALQPKDVEESFEDPFAVRMLPDSPRFSAQARYFNLGRTAAGTGVFSVYRTNGRQIRVLFARVTHAEENFFYQRKVNQMLAS